MKTILKALLLLVALTAVPVFAQSNFEATKARAEAGDDYAQTWLGDMYENGEGVVQNYQEAVKWYRLAATYGNSSAQVNLGIMYAKGRGLLQSYQRAYVWFSVAAANGHPNAQRNRDIASERLTPQELEQAQALATRCFESNYQDCD